LINCADLFKDEMFKQTNDSKNSLISQLFSYFDHDIPDHSILPGYLEKIFIKYIQLFPNLIIDLLLSVKVIIANLFNNIENDSVSNILYELLNLESNPNLNKDTTHDVNLY